MNRMLRLFLPSGALALLAGTILMQPPGAALFDRADTILAVTTAAGLLLTLRFGVSRQFFALVMLIGLGWGAPFFLPPAAGPFPDTGRWHFCMAAMLCLLLSLIEAGLFFAFRDELTVLPARRALNARLQKAGGNYTLAMVDVDHFKRFNDRYGHDVGDEVLRMMATCLKKSSGRAFRYGGEEFTILYPGRRIDRAMADADAVRKRIAETEFTLRSPHRKKGAAPPQNRLGHGQHGPGPALRHRHHLRPGPQGR